MSIEYEPSYFGVDIRQFLLILVVKGWKFVS